MKFKHLLLLLLLNVTSQAQIITTVVGNGTGGYSGDGGPAINAQLGDMYYCYPAFDNAGNMYIASTAGNIIRKIDNAGIITTIAGTSNVMGYTGDGGPAVNALLYHPTALAVDNANNLIISDRNGGVLRKIDASGIITTISGQYTVSCGVGDGGLLINAQFYAISAITTDHSGNLYISDFGCNTIRKVNSAGIISTIAGNGTWGPSGDGGPATSAQLTYPCAVAIDNVGNVFIADAQNNRIRKVSTSGIITTVAGNGTRGYSGDGGSATLSQLNLPGSVVIDNAGNLYTGDYSNVIRKIDPSGIITTYAGTGSYGYSGDGGPAILADMTLTEGRISIDNNDNIYFADEVHYVIRKISNCLTASITLQPVDSALCSSGNASFSVTAVSANSFSWQVNTGTGWISVVDNSIYSGAATSILKLTGATTTMNGNKYRCIVTNNCASIFSVTAKLIVNTPSVPTVTISTSANNICQGTPVTFTAVPANGDSMIIYHWMKNGITVGADTSSYTNNTLNNGDTVFCEITSSNSCLSGYNFVSNKIIMQVNPMLTPSISISPSLNNVCAGVAVNFSSTITNGGNSPIYQWTKNGNNVGTNSVAYVDSTLNNGDTISCMLTTSNSCSTTSNILSNKVTMNITALTTPTVVINASATAVCPRSPVTFNAITSNAGNSPIFNWRKNNTPIGTSTNTYTANNILQGDFFTCSITVNGTCLSTLNATSNVITVSLFQTPIVALEHTTSLCTESYRQLDAGNFSTYLWNDGSTGRNLIINNTGTYYVTVTDNNGCVGSDTTKILTILPKPSNFLPGDTSVCTYGTLTLSSNSAYRDYLWNDFSSGTSLTIKQPGIYWLEVTDNNSCKGRDTIIVSSKQCITGFYVPTAFTPNNDGKNDLFRPLIFGNVKSYNFTIYNRWGVIVFQTTDPTKGWGGDIKTVNQNSNVFVWTCKYQLDGEKQELKKGSVILMR